MIELLPRLVPGEDEAVSSELERAFKKRGIKVMTGSKVTRQRPAPRASTSKCRAPDGKLQKLSFDLLLVATGRGPVTRASTRRSSASRWIAATSSSIRCSRPVPGISAIGDVITMGGPHYQLAHVSSMEGIVLAERIAGHGAADQLRPRAALHLHRAGDRQRRLDGSAGQGARS